MLPLLARPLPLAPTALRAGVRRGPARAWLAACLVLLVLAQSLGLMHRVAHVPGVLVGQPELRQAPARALQANAQADTPQAEAPGHGKHWTHELFAGHGDPDCRLLDALSHPACPAPPVLALPAQLASAPLAAAHGDFVARWAALFDARGPPALR